MKLSFLEKLKRLLKLFYSFPKYKNIIKQINHGKGKRAILIGTPVHGNLGDHLIAKESIRYLQKFNFDNIIEVPEILYELYYNNLKFSKNDIIFISGGGWMGSLYYDELIIEDIITRFKENIIIILPQTVSFNGGNYTTTEKLSEILNSHPNILLTLRDEKSYNICKDDLKIDESKILLLPDMALCGLDFIRQNKNRENKIIFSIRNDREKNSNIDFNNLKKLLAKDNIEIMETSSVINKKVIKNCKRNYYLNKKIEEFSTANLVITDRLHSMVFSLLSGTKCIAIDNSTHKVVGVFKKWLYDFNGILIIQENENLTYEMILKFLNNDIIIESKKFNDYFKILDKRIGEILL